MLHNVTSFLFILGTISWNYDFLLVILLLIFMNTWSNENIINGVFHLFHINQDDSMNHREGWIQHITDYKPFTMYFFRYTPKLNSMQHCAIHPQKSVNKKISNKHFILHFIQHLMLLFYLFIQILMKWIALCIPKLLSNVFCLHSISLDL